MLPGKELSENNDKHLGGLYSVAPLLTFLDGEIFQTEEFYRNLESIYDRSIYEQFENRFIDLRNRFKGKLRDISDPDYEFINQSEMRQNSVEQVLSCASSVVSQFQIARENDRLDRSACTDALEDLLYAIKNLKYLIEEQGRI